MPPRNCAPEALEAPLARREADGLYRRRRVVTARDGAVVEVDGRRLVEFCSNDYLGLATHPDVAAARAAAARASGAGAGASHVVTGHHTHHHELEDAIARFTGRERALLFSTGYMANLGIGAAFARRGTVVVEDRLNHASLLDAGRAYGARTRRYAHGDADAARARLQAAGDGPKVLFTDGVFSMDGDIAPLPGLASACADHDAWLVVDDAHGLGVVGASGRGSIEHYRLSPRDVPVLMGTLGKAFGSFGAFVAGSDAVIETLIQFARTYIYTTALPPAVAAAARAAITIADSDPEPRRRVHANVAHFRSALATAGLESTAHPDTPIQPVIVGGARRAVEVSDALERCGYWVTAIRPPTVPEGAARLRVTLSAAHDDDQIDGLVAALAEALA